MKRHKDNLAVMPGDHSEPEVEWSDYPRIEPGTYWAYSRDAHWYYDPNYKRWVCRVSFDVLSADLLHAIAPVPFFLNGGEGKRPKAGRRSKYWAEWARAAGGPPARRDRLSPMIFTHRMARVEVEDTDGATPYSVVRKVLSWETGMSFGQSVNQSHSQGRHLG